MGSTTMSAVATFDPLQATDRFYTMVKSLNEFDKMEVRGVIETLLSTSGRERCFIGTYHRAMANIETLLEFKRQNTFRPSPCEREGCLSWLLTYC